MYVKYQPVHNTLAQLQSKSLRYREGDKTSLHRVERFADTMWRPKKCQFIEGEYTKAEMRELGDEIKCRDPIKPDSSYCEKHHARTHIKVPKEPAQTP